MKVNEELEWRVPAVLGLNRSKTAGGVIWDLGAVDSPAWEPELVLDVGAVGVLLVQTGDDDKTGKHLLQCLWEGRTSVPVSAASLVALASTRPFPVGRPWEGALAAPCRAQESCPLAPLGRGFWPRSRLSCPITLKTYPTTVHMSNCAAEHPRYLIIMQSVQ